MDWSGVFPPTHHLPNRGPNTALNPKTLNPEPLDPDTLPPLQEYNAYGKYKLRMWDRNKKKFVTVVIDDSIPCVRNSKPIQVKCIKPPKPYVRN